MLNTNDTATAAQSINPKAWTEEEQRLIDAGTIDDDVFADRLFEQIEAAAAFITAQQVDLIEEKISHDVSRRAGLIFATMPGGELCEKISHDREFAVAAASLLSNMDDAKNRYHQLADLLDSVRTRISIALCSRDDMLEVIADGRALAEADE